MHVTPTRRIALLPLSSKKQNGFIPLFLSPPRIMCFRADGFEVFARTALAQNVFFFFFFVYAPDAIRNAYIRLADFLENLLTLVPNKIPKRKPKCRQHKIPSRKMVVRVVHLRQCRLGQLRYIEKSLLDMGHIAIRIHIHAYTHIYVYIRYPKNGSSKFTHLPSENAMYVCRCDQTIVVPTKKATRKRSPPSKPNLVSLQKLLYNSDFRVSNFVFLLS
jgi:hypothetical protein